MKNDTFYIAHYSRDNIFQYYTNQHINEKRHFFPLLTFSNLHHCSPVTTSCQEFLIQSRNPLLHQQTLALWHLQYHRETISPLCPRLQLLQCNRLGILRFEFGLAITTTTFVQNKHVCPKVTLLKKKLREILLRGPLHPIVC